MNWTRQVIHVAMQDVRKSRAFIGIYALVVAAAAIANLWEDGAGPFVMLVLLVGMLYTADLIVEDSPYRADAFWASKPFFPTAVFMAKVLVAAIVVVGCALTAHAVALVIGYGAVPPEMQEQLAGSALIAAASIFGAALIGAVTPNLRTFFLVLVTEFIVTNLFAAWLANAGFSEREFFGPIQKFVALGMSVLLPLLFLAWIYHTRSRTQGIVLAIIMALLPFAARRGVAFATGPELPANERGAVVRIVEVPSRYSVPGEFSISIQLQSFDPSREYNLVEPRAELHYVDGRVAGVPMLESRISLNDPVPRIDAADWIGQSTMTGQRTDGILGGRHSVQLTVTPTQVTALTSGDARLVLYGRIQVLEPYVVASVPLEAGRSIAARGQRLEITSVELKGEGSRFRVRGVDFSIVNDRAEASPSSYALLSRERGEAVELWTVAGGSTIYGVLPSPYYANKYEQEFSLPGDTTRYHLSPNWFRDAELVRIHWRDLGSYAVTIPQP